MLRFFSFRKQFLISFSLETETCVCLSAASAREEEEEIEEETVGRRLEGKDQEKEQIQTQELVVKSQKVENGKQVQSHRHGLEQ